MADAFWRRRTMKIKQQEQQQQGEEQQPQQQEQQQSSYPSFFFGSWKGLPSKEGVSLQLCASRARWRRWCTQGRSSMQTAR